MSCQLVTAVPLASKPCVKLILTRSVKSKRKYRKNDVPVAGVTSTLYIKYVGRRVGKALGNAVGLRMIFGGKGRNKFLCIIDAASYCRCTSLYRLLNRSLSRLTKAVDGGGPRRNALRQSELPAGPVQMGIMMVMPLKCWERTHKGIGPFLSALCIRLHNT